MFLLKIIAVMAALFGIYLFTQWFNAFTEKESGYHFFTAQSFGWFAASYIVMYTGYSMIESNWKGDPINGVIVLLIGLGIFAMQIRTNFKYNRPMVAIAGSLLQSILYAPLTVLGLFALFIAIAAVSGIRPVYCVNGD